MKGTYALLKFLSRWCCGMSPAGAERMGNALGKFFWLCVPPRRKRLAVDNILRSGVAENEEAAWRIAKASSLRFGPLGVSMFRFPLLTKENIRDHVTIIGAEKLDAIKASGKGCILAATHCGNWEVEGAALALYGYPLLAVAMKQKNEEFDRFITEYRSMPGQTVEYKTGVRDMLRRLKQGYFVGLLCDQDPGETGILSPFLGQRTLTATGPAHFSVACGLPVMTALIHQTGREKYTIIIDDPITADEEADKKEAIQQITDRINARLEAWIRKYPEEWFWLHNRWKWTDKLYPEERK